MPRVKSKRKEMTGKLVGGAASLSIHRLVIKGKAVSLDGIDDAVVIPRNPSMDVGKGISPWLRGLTQASCGRRASFAWADTTGFTAGIWTCCKGVCCGLRPSVLPINPMGPWLQSPAPSGQTPGSTWRRWYGGARIKHACTSTDLRWPLEPLPPLTWITPRWLYTLVAIQGSRLFKGQMDEVRFYKRALDLKEIHALLEPGKQFVRKPPEPPQELDLEFGWARIYGQYSSTGIFRSSPAGGAAAGERSLWRRLNSSSHQSYSNA